MPVKDVFLTGIIFLSGGLFLSVFFDCDVEGQLNEGFDFC